MYYGAVVYKVIMSVSGWLNIEVKLKLSIYCETHWTQMYSCNVDIIDIILEENISTSVAPGNLICISSEILEFFRLCPFVAQFPSST